MKKVVYTAIFGNYDTPLQPNVITDDWEYILYTDNEKADTGIWKRIVVKPNYPRLYARFIKLNYPQFKLKNYDILFWIDANVVINCDLNEFTKKHQSEFMVLKHPHRDSILKEAHACKKYKKDSSIKIDLQIEKYKNEGYKFDNGLVATTIMLRRNTKAVQEFCMKWWDELSHGSIRDQLSFNYVLWKYPVDLELISWNVFDSDFEYRQHKRWKS